MSNAENESSIYITDSSGDVSRTPIFFNSGSTKNFYEPHENSITCSHVLKKNDYESILCGFLDQWVSAKYCLICQAMQAEEVIDRE